MIEAHLRTHTCARAAIIAGESPMVDPNLQLMASAARLYYLDELDQQQIGAILGVSRSKVSRLLTAAREQGIVRISVDHDDPRDAALEERLRERFGLQRAIVVRVPNRAVESVRRTIGHFAAPAVAALIHPRMVLGVAGGRTVGELIAAIRLPGHRVSDVSVVQLMGYIDPTATRVDAPEVGRILAERCGGSFYTLHAPVFVRDRDTRDALLADEQFQLIWRQFARIDLALVGVGAIEESMFAERGALDRAECRRLRELGAVGEICGRFFDRDGQECDSPYRDRVIGIDLDALRRRPETIAVTNGPARATALHAALRGRLITSVVIDDLGAQTLLETDE